MEIRRGDPYPFDKFFLQRYLLGSERPLPWCKPLRKGLGGFDPPPFQMLSPKGEAVWIHNIGFGEQRLKGLRRVAPSIPSI